MGVEIKIIEEITLIPSLLLELAAIDDVESFKVAVENNGHGVDEVGIWYTRCIGSNTMSYQKRTPLMIAAQYGSVKVLDYILKSGRSDVNRVAGSDRVTALHCAVAGGSESSSSVVLRLVSASANVNLLDATGNRACDLIPNLPKIPTKNKQLDSLLKGQDSDSISISDSDSDSSSKKEYSVAELPDINDGVYGSDEFRMYCFKIKPCSRAYTHDWTECPFAHPGENARRRDPAKYNYTCVPCPEFKKGSCKKGEDCEFAHGVFESWLHPAQYRTRLCKDETGCARKVCFFAHRREELRPVYASTGSALPDNNNMNVSSPRAGGGGGGVGGFSCTSTPPMSPSFAPPSPKNGASGGGGVMWQGKSPNLGGTPPPNLLLPGSRLRSSLSARDMEFERELLKLEHQIQHQQHHQMMSPRWNNSGRMGDMSPSNLETHFNSINLSRNMSMSMPMSMSMSPSSVLDSPINIPRKMSPPNVLDSPKAMAMLNSRAAAFAQRSQSFIDRPGTMNANPSSPMSTNVSDWSSPNGKLDWGMQGEELNKLRKSNSFGFRGNNNNPMRASPPGFGEPDVSWVNSLVKDEVNAGFVGARSPNYGRGAGAGASAGAGVGVGQGNGARVQDMCLPWEQLYKEQELAV